MMEKIHHFYLFILDQVVAQIVLHYKFLSNIFFAFNNSCNNYSFNKKSFW